MVFSRIHHHTHHTSCASTTGVKQNDGPAGDPVLRRGLHRQSGSWGVWAPVPQHSIQRNGTGVKSPPECSSEQRPLLTGMGGGGGLQAQQIWQMHPECPAECAEGSLLHQDQMQRSKVTLDSLHCIHCIYGSMNLCAMPGGRPGLVPPPCISYANVHNYYSPYAYCSFDKGVACAQHIQLPTHTCAGHMC